MFKQNQILTEHAADVALDRYFESIDTGATVRYFRRQARISRAQLAQYAGMSETTLARVEKGERALRGPERIALSRGLGVGLAALSPRAERTAKGRIEDEHNRRAAAHVPSLNGNGPVAA